MILILGGAGESTRMVYHAMAASGLAVERVIIEEPVPLRHVVRRRIAKFGLVTVAGQIGFRLIAVPLLSWLSQGRIHQIKAEYSLDDRPIPFGLLSRVPSVNGPETQALLQQLKPAVVVVIGTRIISAHVLDQLPGRFVNIHAGITRRYRGVHGGYWALVEKQPEACGVTVHMVDSGIDTGPVLAQAIIRPQRRDNFATYPFLQLGVGLPLLVEAVRNLAGASIPAPIQPLQGESRLYSHPTLVEYLRYWLVRGVR